MSEYLRAAGMAVALIALLLPRPSVFAAPLLNQPLEKSFGTLHSQEQGRPTSQRNNLQRTIGTDESVQLQQLRDPATAATLQAQVEDCSRAVTSKATQKFSTGSQPSTAPSASESQAAPVNAIICPAPVDDTLPTRQPLRYNIRNWWTKARLALTIRQSAEENLLENQASDLRCAAANCISLNDRACADRAVADLQAAVDRYQQVVGAGQGDDFAACAMNITFTLADPAPDGNVPGPTSPTPIPGTRFQPIGNSTDIFGSSDTNPSSNSNPTPLPTDEP